MENNNPQSEQNPPVLIMDTKVETRSHLDKLADVFLPEDLNSISNNIVNQIIIPAILKTAGDIIHRSIDMIFGTNYTGTNTKPPESAASNWVSYSSAQNRNNTSTSQAVGTMQILPVRSGVYDYSIVKFRSVALAQHVLQNMRSVLQNTGKCSVGKYLEFAEAKTIPEDYNYGWLDLRTVSVEKVDNSEYPWRMNLPNPVALPRETERFYI